MAYGNQGGMNPRAVPVKVGDEFDIQIEGVGEKGDGIAKKEGFVLFVPGTKAGQNARIRVTKVLRSVGFAEVIGDAEGGAPAEEESAPAEESAEEPAEEEAPVESAEDSEDFGEEESAEEPVAEESSEEAPAEESSEEAPEEPAEEEKKE